MKAKKLGRVEQLEKKMHSCTQLIEQLLRQNTYLRDLAVGTLETIKLMPDYEAVSYTHLTLPTKRIV